MDKFSLPQDYRKYYRSLEPMLAKPKTKRYSTVIFFFLTIALFGWYAIRPTMQTILYLQKEIVDKKAVNIQMDEKINALIEAQAILENIQPVKGVIANTIPKNPQAVDIARQLQNLAQTTQASLSAIQIGSVPILTATTSAAAPSYVVKHTPIPITVSIDGPYSVLASFMSGLLTMQRIVTIDSISFSPNKSGMPQPGLSAIRLQLKLTAFYQNY
jgi:Tfp pilus assembly protein PilO